MNLDRVIDARRKATNSAGESLTIQSTEFKPSFSLDEHSIVKLKIPYTFIEWRQSGIPIDDKGIGDIGLVYSHDIHLHEQIQAILTLGIELPTGDHTTDNLSDTIPINNVRLGSGTFDPSAGIAFVTKGEGIRYFLGLAGTFQGGADDAGVRLGDSFSSIAGAFSKLSESYTTAISLEHTSIKPTRVDDVQVRNSGYTWIFLSVENSLTIASYVTSSLKLSYPIYRNVNGRQLAPDELTVTLNLSIVFN